jgi:dipeptidyl aminopeptidase/acylaminoacyl peptidase
MVSEDGRRIFFQTPAGTDSGAIYMREDGVRTVQLAQDGQLWTASADGSRVFFTTSESLLPEDTDSSRDLYMYDANAPANARLTLVSASGTVNEGDVGGVIGASADGRYVYFVCSGQLVAGEPPADIAGLYVWHDGHLAFIGSLRDSGEGKLNGPRTEFTFEGTTSTSRVSPDGRHLLFMTHDDTGFRGHGGFGGYDHAGHRELYLYSADTGRLVCASCDPSGRAATADALTDQRKGAAVSEKTSKLSHALSDDGQHVFFTTAEALVAGDTNGVADAYVYDTAGATVRLLSSGVDPSPSYFIDASDDGNNAFFVTRQRLVRWDTDNSYDLYDARVGGGFPEPVAAAPECAGEGCLPQGTRAPVGSLPGSAGYNGAGNTTNTAKPKPVVHHRCVGNTVARRIKGHTRCVRRPHRHVTNKHATRTGTRNQRSAR